MTELFLVFCRIPSQIGDYRYLDSIWVNEENAKERTENIRIASDCSGWKMVTWIAKRRLEDAVLKEDKPKP